MDSTPTVSITAQNTIVDPGQYVSFSAIPSGGSGTFGTYNFIVFNSISNTVLANQLSSSSTFAFATNSQWVTNSPIQANVIVTDTGTTTHYAFNSSELATAITVSSAALGTPTIIQSNTLLDSGQYETLNTMITGGSGSYTVDFYNVTGSNTLQIFGYRQWLSTNAYPIDVNQQSCVTSSNNIYCVAGAGPTDTAVYYAPVFSSTVLGAWISTNAYAGGVTVRQSCATSSNNIYCVGGSNGFSTSAAVYYAPIFSSGAVGTWTSENAYPANIDEQSCVTYSNNIYCIGGYDGTNAQSYVYQASIFSSGAVGTWTSENAYPFAVDGGLGDHRCVR